MQNLLFQHPLTDIAIYGFLLFAFHRCVYRSPRVCLVISILALVKVVHTCSINSDAFWIGFNVLLFGALWVGLYFTRYSPNYFWLFSALIFIKLVDISTFSWFTQQGIWHTVFFFIGDAFVLILLDQRHNLVGWLAGRDWGKISQAAQKSQSVQRLSIQEILLMAIYWISMLSSLSILIEYGINRYVGELLSTFFYEISSYIKLPLTLAEFVLLFNIATGHALCAFRRERVW